MQNGIVPKTKEGQHEPCNQPKQGTTKPTNT